MLASTIPTISDVERIAALSNPVLRNLQITQCYHELALVLAERTGSYANWCTFATWASKQAGQTIRKEDLARALKAAFGADAAAKQSVQDLRLAAQPLGTPLEAGQVNELVWNAYDPQAPFERSSAAVARGNLKVFAEIAGEFARFYADCLPDQAYNPDKIQAFCEALRPGDPPDGQGHLRQAFQGYYQALFEADEKQRVELLHFANLEIGYHEQNRLQPEIIEALEAPVVPLAEFAANLLKVLRPQGGWLSALILLILRLLGGMAAFNRAVERVAEEVQRQVQILITETMMTIALPDQPPLRLSQDLAAPFPLLLEHIANPDLLALLAQIDPTPDSTRGSGAKDWGDLPDRLHFIADMFRCYAETPQLLEPPFDPGQTTAIKEGRIPEGPL